MALLWGKNSQRHKGREKIEKINYASSLGKTIDGSSPPGKSCISSKENFQGFFFLMALLQGKKLMALLRGKISQRQLQRRNSFSNFPSEFIFFYCNLPLPTCHSYELVAAKLER